jgi:hypothetical protein
MRGMRRFCENRCEAVMGRSAGDPTERALPDFAVGISRIDDHYHDHEVSCRSRTAGWTSIANAVNWYRCERITANTANRVLGQAAPANLFNSPQISDQIRQIRRESGWFWDRVHWRWQSDQIPQLAVRVTLSAMIASCYWRLSPIQLLLPTAN